MIMGQGLGYSNVKSTYGNADKKPETAIFPVDAVPLKTLKNVLRGMQGGDLNITKVDVDGETYNVGFEPGKIASSSRYISETYTQTKECRALFYAGLLHAETDEIDVLITGLPVSHYKNEVLRQGLIDMKQGEYRIGERRTINVKQVRVISQPGGGFLNAMSEAMDKGNSKNVNMMNHGCYLVIYPGYFSNDFVVFEEDSLVQEASDSTLHATYKIIERAAQRISDSIRHAAGKGLEPYKLESAIRKKTIIYFQGEEVDINKEIEVPSKVICRLTLAVISSCL
ncbi:hypothetical protein [Stutzerimonas xanthomarina]|uniref:ParM/StbA family protein n=1 Tax=Stutzerimonas xanthomarina TaxID=271420 RepID=UPI003AA99F96